MKDYREVVKDRYEKEVIRHAASLSRRALHMHKYQLSVIVKCVRRVTSFLLKEYCTMHELSLPDIGYGNDKMPEEWKEEGIKEENITGVDLSQKRINYAKNLLLEAMFPMWIVRLAEQVIPATPGNRMYIARKIEK